MSTTAPESSLAARIAHVTILHPAMQVALLLWGAACLAVLLLADGTLPLNPSGMRPMR